MTEGGKQMIDILLEPNCILHLNLLYNVYYVWLNNNGEYHDNIYCMNLAPVYGMSIINTRTGLIYMLHYSFMHNSPPLLWCLFIVWLWLAHSEPLYQIAWKPRQKVFLLLSTNKLCTVWRIMKRERLHNGSYYTNRYAI